MNLFTQHYEWMLIGGMLSMTALQWLLTFPESPHRAFLTRLAGSATAMCCILYVICPMDVIPEMTLGSVGFLDDIGAVVVGIRANRFATGD